MRAAIAGAVISMLSLGLVPSSAAAEPPGVPYRTHRPVGGSGAASGDFDNDGFGDLAVGIPGEDLGDVLDAGSVQVIFGSATGLTTEGNQLLSQNAPGLGAGETGDRFGASLSSGDFDGDGNSDLAIGVPGEDVGDTVDAGEVQVVFGTNSGLNLGGAQTFEGNEANARFGTVLAWANFGRGPQGDLAIGTPSDDVAGLNNAGQVQVIYGSPAGLDFAGRQIITQNNAVLGPVEIGDQFGSALAAADMGKSGLADLAIGTPTENVGDLEDAGIVQVLYGSPDGLKIGGAMATGSFDGLGKQDLAIGIPLEDVFLFDHGAVALAFGRAEGIGPVTRFIAEQFPSDGIGTDDQFGRVLAAADFDLDGITDLAVGIPFEDFEPPDHDPQVDTGAVLVFRGTVTGRPEAVQVLIDTFRGSADKFGAALTAWDFGAGPAPDLVVGVPFDNPFNLTGKTTPDGGSAQAFYSSGNPSAPFNPGERRTFVQEGPQLPDNMEIGDQFGGAVY
jgi:hypothetical protein